MTRERGQHTGGTIRAVISSRSLFKPSYFLTDNSGILAFHSGVDIRPWPAIHLLDRISEMQLFENVLKLSVIVCRC